MSILPIVDRRLSGKNKSIGNRERFLRRQDEYVRRAVGDALDKAGIKGLDSIKGADVHVPKKGISQPVFQHSTQGGIRETVHTGNKDFIKGDKIPRPKGGAGGQGNGTGNGDGDTEDAFSFALTRDEFLKALFDGLELPNMLRTILAEATARKSVPNGIVTSGTPNNLHVVRSLKAAIGRRFALDAPAKREVARLESEFNDSATPENRRQEITSEIERLKARKGSPYIDPVDLRFRSREKKPVPESKAVMFCLMDQSASMGQHEKDIAKRYYMLLYTFLEKHYDKMDVVFIRYTTTAKECDERAFFYSTESGGTNVSCALELMDEIIKERYAGGNYNIYGALASDGDTGGPQDAKLTRTLMENEILPSARYFSYIEIANREKPLSDLFGTIPKNMRENIFAQRRVNTIGQIWEVFRDLFKAKGVNVGNDRLAAFSNTMTAQP